MKRPSLDSLPLDEHEIEAAKDEIRSIAFNKWQLAGCPDDSDVDFWIEAEVEWIEFRYVPHRYPDDPSRRQR